MLDRPVDIERAAFFSPPLCVTGANRRAVAQARFALRWLGALQSALTKAEQTLSGTVTRRTSGEIERDMLTETRHLLGALAFATTYAQPLLWYMQSVSADKLLTVPELQFAASIIRTLPTGRGINVELFKRIGAATPRLIQLSAGRGLKSITPEGMTREEEVRYESLADQLKVGSTRRPFEGVDVANLAQVLHARLEPTVLIPEAFAGGEPKKRKKVKLTVQQVLAGAGTAPAVAEAKEAESAREQLRKSAERYLDKQHTALRQLVLTNVVNTGFVGATGDVNVPFDTGAIESYVKSSYGAFKNELDAQIQDAQPSANDIEAYIVAQRFKLAQQGKDATALSPLEQQRIERADRILAQWKRDAALTYAKFALIYAYYSLSPFALRAQLAAARKAAERVIANGGRMTEIPPVAIYDAELKEALLSDVMEHAQVLHAERQTAVKAVMAAALTTMGQHPTDSAEYDNAKAQYNEADTRLKQLQREVLGEDYARQLKQLQEQKRDLVLGAPFADLLAPEAGGYSAQVFYTFNPVLFDVTRRLWSYSEKTRRAAKDANIRRAHVEAALAVEQAKPRADQDHKKITELQALLEDIGVVPHTPPLWSWKHEQKRLKALYHKAYKAGDTAALQSIGQQLSAGMTDEQQRILERIDHVGRYGYALTLLYEQAARGGDVEDLAEHLEETLNVKGLLNTLDEKPKISSMGIVHREHPALAMLEAGPGKSAEFFSEQPNVDDLASDTLPSAPFETLQRMKDRAAAALHAQRQEIDFRRVQQRRKVETREMQPLHVTAEAPYEIVGAKGAMERSYIPSHAAIAPLETLSESAFALQSALQEERLKLLLKQ
jgi:hypothetical protein